MSLTLCLWSGPRNISTAMMRSFGARKDTLCWDEPFFAPFLSVTGLDHPGRQETLEQCETDPQTVARKLLEPIDKPYHFQKHMAHHILSDFPTGWMTAARHVLLIRHPARVIRSYARGRPTFTEDDLGFSALLSLSHHLQTFQGYAPMIVDSDNILRKPEVALRTLCEDGFGIGFDPDMLSWKAGSRAEDGPWAPYWYDNVIRSTGFGPPPGPLPEVNPVHRSIFERCLSDYDKLRALS